MPSTGSLSSLSSLGSERPAVKKKPSLRFLARVRRDSGQSAASVASVGSAVSAESQRRASQPETGDRVKVRQRGSRWRSVLCCWSWVYHEDKVCDVHEHSGSKATQLGIQATFLSIK